MPFSNDSRQEKISENLERFLQGEKKWCNTDFTDEIKQKIWVPKQSCQISSPLQIMPAVTSMAISCHKTKDNYHTVLKTVIYYKLMKYFPSHWISYFPSKSSRWKKDSKTNITWIIWQGMKIKKNPQEQKCTTQTSRYTVLPSNILYTHLCPVKLSQKVIVPSDPQVITQVWGTPFAFVPTHTKASNPNPRRRLHRRLAWSSQSP